MFDKFPGRSINGGDEGLIARFFIEPVHLTFRSEQEGRPIYEDREFVEILIPGDKKSVHIQPATEYERQRFPREYAAFKASESMELATGTPLAQWPAMTRSMVKEFAASNVFSVEQLANMAESHLQNLGLGAREWSARARAYLEQAKGNAVADALAAENQKLKDDLAAMQRQIADLAAKLTADDEESPAKRKRAAA